MENAEKKNWIYEYENYDMLIEFSRSVNAAYFRLRLNFPNHPDIEKWAIEEQKWKSYFQNVDKLNCETEEEVEAEFEKIRNAHKQANAIYEDLKK